MWTEKLQSLLRKVNLSRRRRQTRSVQSMASICRYMKDTLSGSPESSGLPQIPRITDFMGPIMTGKILYLTTIIGANRFKETCELGYSRITLRLYPLFSSPFTITRCQIKAAYGEWCCFFCRVSAQLGIHINLFLYVVVIFLHRKTKTRSAV